MSTPSVGVKAPQFKLYNQDNELIDSNSFVGKSRVVLYFYPKAMTPGCTVQACGIRDFKQELANVNAVVFGVSPDPVERLVKFRQKEALNFDLLSDPEHLLADEYGVWGLKKFMGKEYMGIKRTTFIIDENGNLVHVMDKVKTKSHHEDVVNFIKENLN